MTAYLIAAIVGYLLGSIPFGYLLTRLAGLGDIRQVGSGNIGATNVLRTGRKDIAAATVLLDAGKGAAAVLLATRFENPILPLIAGAFAVIGHCTSVWMRGRGGKGVATGFGTILALAWPAGLLAAAIWLAVAIATRRSSAAAIAACLAAPALMLALRTPKMAFVTLLVSAIIIFRHHTNITRLLAGTEPRIGAK